MLLIRGNSERRGAPLGAEGDISDLLAQMPGKDPCGRQAAEGGLSIYGDAPSDPRSFSCVPLISSAPPTQALARIVGSCKPIKGLRNPPPFIIAELRREETSLPIQETRLLAT